MSSSYRSHAAGIVYILIAWLLFTLMTIITRFASKEVPLFTILLFQNLIGLATLLPWLKKQGWRLLQTERFGLIFFRSIISLMAVWFGFLAVQRISLLNTMLFNNTSPLWIPFVIYFWQKIPIKHILWPGIIGGFLGVILILKPGSNLIQAGTFFAIGAGLLQSINMVSIRQLSYSERNHTILFYYFLICSVICFPISLMHWTTPSLVVWGEIFVIGILFALGQWAFVRAFHHAKASQLGPFCYSAVVYSVLIDWMLYAQIPDLWAWIGIGLICAGGVWSIKTSPSAYQNNEPQNRNPS
jgi:drug/metabolite transporter (DMT)-like permease